MAKINFHLMDNMEYMKTIPDNYFDLAIIDPPYGIGEDGLKNHSRGNLTSPTKFKPKKWDKKSPNKKFFKEITRVSKNQIIFGANHFIEKIPKANSSCWIVWDKNNTGDFADCELAWTSFKSAVRKIKWTWNGMLQEDMKNKQKRIHPTEKPVGLYVQILKKYAKKGNKIIDTNGGSMSLAIACLIENHDLEIIEIDKDYFNDGIKRFKKYKETFKNKLL